MFKVYTLIIVLCFLLQGASSQAQAKNPFLLTMGTQDSLYSQTLQESRNFYVQLPASYNPNTPEKFPVVYIIDGEVLLPTVHAVQSFYSGGFTPEMVLVGISNAAHRTRDLTPTQMNEKYGMPFNEASGEATNFSAFLENELIPYIEKNYPVTSFRTLIGHSYGGLFAVYTLLHHPQLFSNYIAIDPSLDWDNQKLLGEAKEKLSQNNYANTSLFVSLSGQLHMQDPNITIDNVMQDSSDFTVFARSNIEFSNMVRQHASNGLDFSWKFYPKDIHGTVAFPSIREGLLFNFEWYQMEDTDKFNSPETSKEVLEGIINYRAQKLKIHFQYTVPPYPVDLLNALGYMSLDMEQPEKSKMFFEFAMQFYPNDANTYDSMADYYERTNDFENALKFVTKANTISPNDYYQSRIESLKLKSKK